MMFVSNFFKIFINDLRLTGVELWLITKLFQEKILNY